MRPYCLVTDQTFYQHIDDEISFQFQEANNRSNNWLPPPWAIVAMLVLGFNEFMTILRWMLILPI